MLGATTAPSGDEHLLTVTVVRDEHGYGMKVSGDNPVYVQSVKEHGAAWRAGLRAGDRILKVDTVPVHRHTHQQVVHMIRANPSTVLTVQQNAARNKTSITSPVPVNPEKQRQFEASKVQTVRLMLEQQQKYIRDLKNELSKVPDVRKQAQLETAEQKCAILQHEFDTIMAAQNDTRRNVPVLHVRSQSSPEHLDQELNRSWCVGATPPPPGTPPPPYHRAPATTPCTDPQRAIISMEEDDSPASDHSSDSGLFSNLRSVRESKARTAVLLNWLLAERRSSSACLFLMLTDAFRSSRAPLGTLRRWAYEIHSTFVMPHAVLQINGVDENMANEIEHVLVNEHDKEELLRNVFRKSRGKAKEQLSAQLAQFQVKRRLGLAALYSPRDSVLAACSRDPAQEAVVVERLLCGRISSMAAAAPRPDSAPHTELCAAVAAALAQHCRPASVLAAAGGARGCFLQRDKLYKQRLKHLAKHHPNPLVNRGHHLQLTALTSVGHCHHCDNVITGLAPQAYLCTDCKLRVHLHCAKSVEESCCLDGEHHNNRISRFMERIQPNNQDSSDKKSRKSSGTSHFLNMERSFRKMEDDQHLEQTLTHSVTGESRREGSTDDAATENDNDPPDAALKDTTDKDNNWRAPTSAPSRGVNRAESCRERDAPRRGKHRNASDPNRLTAHNHHDLEPGAPTAASASSSSSSLSSRSNESNTVAAEHQASQSELSDEEEPLAAQWTDSLPPNVLDTLLLDARIRKRQEVVHELIVSEGSHVRWLKVLGRFFLRPLESQPSLLPPEELKALFPNLPGVRERHAKLYTELRAVRNNATNHVVEIGPVAEAMLNTLGDSGYSSCLSRFCRGQRMALESLRERRRKNKELHQFLTGKEQQPLCARLQLKDLLACVWQRLTKYQLLLESILKTTDEDEQTNNKDIEILRRALAVAKQVLQTVDTSIRTAENEHRLRSIQSKLEVRAPLSAEWEELRRLELTHKTLRLEGDLAMKVDNKRTNVLALFFSDCLVLLHREGDKFVLRPSPQNSPKPALLSPLIRWDRVIFRPNAALRNTFFLMNINGVQMHELSVASSQEYTHWVKCIQEAPLISDLKPLTVSHTPTKSNDDSGINVSRNPSDASEKSDKSDKSDNAEKTESVDKTEVGDKTEPDKCTPPPIQDNDNDDNNSLCHALVRAPSVDSGCPAALVASEHVRVTPPVAASLATTVTSTREQIRRLDAEIMAAMRAKSECVAELLHVPRHQQRMLEEMAVADAHCQLDEYIEPFDRIPSSEDELANLPHLVLAAQAQMNQLLEVIQRSMSAPESSLVALTTRSRCDHCTTQNKIRTDPATSSCSPSSHSGSVPTLANLQKEQSYDMLSELDSRTTEEPVGDVLERAWSGVQLARRLAPVACGLHCTLGRVAAALHSLPAAAAQRAQRAQRAAHSDRAHRDHAARTTEYQTIDEASYHDSDPTIQDEPSNGG